jgi:hypothetical protein
MRRKTTKSVGKKVNEKQKQKSNKLQSMLNRTMKRLKLNEKTN